MTHIERYYVDSVSTSDLYGKAIDGMLDELHDPHSVFLRADRLARLNESTTGNYGGVGIQIDVRDGWVIVVAPLAGLARRARGHRDRRSHRRGRRQVRQGLDDRRDAQDAPRRAGHDGVDRHRSAPGTERPVTLVRQEIHRSAVGRSLLLPDGVGYVDLDVFSDSTEKELSRVDRLAVARRHAARSCSTCARIRADC